jgi:hypothetical protein
MEKETMRAIFFRTVYLPEEHANLPHLDPKTPPLNLNLVND